MAEFHLIRGWRDAGDFAASTIPQVILGVIAGSSGNWFAAMGFGCAGLIGAIYFAQKRACDGWRELFRKTDAHNDTLFALLCRAENGVPVATEGSAPETPAEPRSGCFRERGEVDVRQRYAVLDRVHPAWDHDGAKSHCRRTSEDAPMTAPSKTNPQGPSLDDLLSRVEAATGPDGELDAALWLRFVPGTTRKATTVNHPKGPYIIDETREHFRLVTVPAYSASLDAALALCERVLPGWAWCAAGPDAETSEPLCWATLAGPVRMVKLDWDGPPEPDRETITSYAMTPALALLAALLKAVQAQSQGQFHDGSTLESQAPTKMDGDPK